MTIDYQALREKAEKATCGVWSLEYGEGRFDGDDALIHREAAGYIPICRIEGAHPESGFDEDFQMEQQANAEFIAAANPATVLALLDELERKQQYIKRRDQENEEIALTVGRLLIENGQLVADTLRHLADNEIDSDYFAITSTNENGTEIDHEMAITDYALQAAGTVDELVAALESAEKRIAELEAEPVSQAYNLPELIEGMEVSIDVSTCDADLGNRYFGTVTEALELDTAKNGYILLVQDAEPNFDVNGNSPVIPDGWVMVPKELTPEMMRAVQIRSELGGYATSNLSGAYNMFSEFWNVAVSAAPKVDDL
ncbi:ead/Ea22-like family protein [Escherichia coli]|uniref:ead/Ea22-like family protein n=1 Tax=Escherichia coli TaxID=562 RepID=UPI0019AB9688|nr:ead/Ea22-like family protein [Escherichia coli]CAD5490191.1 putative DnaJ-class molecular chaperone with C-terminal Zn finger domain [Escherichia coli]